MFRKSADNNGLMIFGYACNLFRDDQKALEMDQGKHLIPWNGMVSLMIDRYDARGHFSELSQFECLSYDFVPTPDEKEIEKFCDKERYLAMEACEEEHLMYQEEERKRLRPILSNNKYGQVAYQYTDNTQPQVITSNSEESTQEDFEPFVPSPSLHVPHNMILPSSKNENKKIEKAASYIAAHGSQVEIMVRARQANNEKLEFMQAGSPLNPYYNFMLDRIKLGIYRPGSLIHTHEEINQKDDQKYPLMSLSSTVESALTIPDIVHKSSVDSSYDLLVKSIMTVQQAHKSNEAKMLSLPSNKYLDKDELSSKTHCLTKNQIFKDNLHKIPPPNIREIISKLFNFARTLGLHPSELAPKLLKKKNNNIEFLLPEHPYHWYYKEQLELLFKDDQESLQESETLLPTNSSLKSSVTKIHHKGQ